MACWFARVGALLVVSLLAACGSHGEGASAIQAIAKPYFPDGGGAAGRGGTSDGDLGGGFGGPRWSGPPTPTVPAPPITFSGRVEESESTAV
ncbi:MAG TPA: hypothetical protein VD970_10365, partial [Acetobacteraceae bacterium]|nr:hypothetical protein [Acetobacteraceae bacterium]